MDLEPFLLDILACPRCHAALRADDAANELVCTGSCRLAYPVRDGIPVMLIDEATPGPVPTQDEVEAARKLVPEGKPALVGVGASSTGAGSTGANSTASTGSSAGSTAGTAAGGGAGSMGGSASGSGSTTASSAGSTSSSGGSSGAGAGAGASSADKKSDSAS